MAEIITSGQVVLKITEGLHLMDGIEGLRSLPRHSVDMLLTDPPYGTTKNYWDTPMPLPELWEAIRWAVKPNGAVLLFAQCPFDKALGVSNLGMLRYEWVWVKAKATGFLNANRAPLKKTENILVIQRWAALSHKCAVCPGGDRRHPSHTKACGAMRVFHQNLHRRGSSGSGYLRWLRDNRSCGAEHRPPLYLF